MDPFVMFVSRALHEERVAEAARRHRWDDVAKSRWHGRLAWLLLAIPFLRAR